MADPSGGVTQETDHTVNEGEHYRDVQQAQHGDAIGPTTAWV
jgi:hypothetical protein